MSISDISPTQSPGLSTASLYSAPPLPCLRICSSPVAHDEHAAGVLALAQQLRARARRSRPAACPRAVRSPASGRPAKIGMRARNARSTSAIPDRRHGAGCYLDVRAEGSGRSGRQALAGEALGELGVGVARVAGAARRGLRRAPRAADPARAGRARGCGARAAGRCRRRRRRRSPGSCRRRAASPSAMRGRAQATRVQAAGRRARRPVGADGARGRRAVSAKKSPRRALPFAVGDRRRAGALRRAAAASTPVARDRS